MHTNTEAAAVMERPPKPDYAPDFVVAPDPEWKLIRGGDFPGGRCRQGSGMGRQACRHRAVAALRRPRYGSAGTWWAYCAEHMYGRWIEGGRVMCWQPVPSEDEP